MRVFYQPSTHEPLPGASVPSYLSLLRQGAAEVWEMRPDLGGTPAPEWVGTLAYGRELVLRTEGSSTLWVRPPTSSP